MKISNFGHGGNIYEMARRCGCKPDDILDFSANVNPLGPPESLRSTINRTLTNLKHYPDPFSRAITEKIATIFGLSPDEIVVGNGTSELLFVLPRLLACKRAVIPVPSYIDYELSCSNASISVEYFYLRPEDTFLLDPDKLGEVLLPGDLVIIGQPNNPTGRLVDRDALLSICRKNPECFFIVDEAFAGFIKGYSSLCCAEANIIVLYSLTKLFAFPGLRLGFLAASPEICLKVKKALPPWSVNMLAQTVGEEVLSDKSYLGKTREYIADHLNEFINEINLLPGLRAHESAVNFLLVEIVGSGINSEELAEKLLKQSRIVIRVCSNYKGLNKKYFRVAFRGLTENRKLIEGLRKALLQEDGTAVEYNGRNKTKKGKAIMLQGTGSDAGKSVLVSALCRILLQDGIKVAPFKAQNMSLNSFVTRDGKEMGRAQVVQAQASKLDPDVRMNPVLLKPSSDVGCQVILDGHPVGNMNVHDYMRYKPYAWKQICRSFDSLRSEFDVIVLEGAGSPGEINLKSHDIVNMKMARYADSPVLLVGDIDKGGVYASFIGHIEVMDEWERRLMAGFIVNRFRGEDSLLKDAHDYIFNRTGLPVLGVIPYIDNLGLPQEDSVSFKAGLYDLVKPAGQHVEIAVIDLPHISNFTDIEALIQEKDVWVRIIRRKEELGTPDAVILPGSKNVMVDLDYLKRSGIVTSLLDLAEKGVEIVGICGGFQMLGRVIADPFGLEHEEKGRITGLSLLKMDTELAFEKTMVRKTGIHLQSGCKVSGYEIHHGLSNYSENCLIRFNDMSECGICSENGLVWGSYLHGIFDEDLFRRWFVNKLRLKKGMPAGSLKGIPYNLEASFDRLAGLVRQALDMDLVYQMLGL